MTPSRERMRRLRERRRGRGLVELTFWVPREKAAEVRRRAAAAGAVVPRALDRGAVLRRLRAHERDIRARGVARLALFGSVARGAAEPGSDIDVVVDIEPGRKFSLIDHASLRGLLSDILGQEVDVVVKGSLKPDFRERIARESVPVF